MAEFAYTPASSSNLSFPRTEEEILAYWDDRDVFPEGAFQESLKRNEKKPIFTFYDGPPFATGLPHHGHITAGSLKDVVTRYAHQTGHHVERRFGWDCHGVPVENEINKAYKIHGRADVERPDRGVKWYNDECRAIVLRYVGEWRRVTRRIGRWIDFDRDYKTMDASFMESVWSVFKRLWDLDLVYRGVRVMPISTALGTPISNHEIGPETYRETSDPAIVVSFPIEGDPDKGEFLAWTTTPWTLPSNIALCVNAEIDYVKVRDKSPNKPHRLGRVFVLAKELLREVFKDEKEYEILGDPAGFKGKTLVGRRYVPLFDYFANTPSAANAGYFRVVSDDYVTNTSGVGIVHLAPGFGEDDFRVCVANKLCTPELDSIPCPVSDEGIFLAPLPPDLQGKHVKHDETNQLIVKTIKAAGRLISSGSIVHKVPFCARSQTPLIYKALPSWYVRVETNGSASPHKTSIRERMIENNKMTKWVPTAIGERRFHEWLCQARDWNISRNRYWGTPIPVWTNDDGEAIAVGSIEELRRLTGHPDVGQDIHRQFVDALEIPSSKPGGKPLKRITEVFDCWFESGSMPYAQKHYMFDGASSSPPPGFPADFIAEGLDQTRGWFYTLMVLSTALFNLPPFKNVVVNGLVLAADGKKMSKSLRNFPPPEEVIDRHGADALRMYLINSPVVRAEPLRFVEDGVAGVVREIFLPWLNAYRFFDQNVRRFEALYPGMWDCTRALENSRRSTNVMDHWIVAESRDLTNFVRREMEAYHLYTVVPRLVRFVDLLTNWFVRLNRARLKGSAVVGGGEEEEGGEEDGGGGAGVTDERDTLSALSTLYEVLLSITRLMSPVTPFFTEYLYQRLCPRGTSRRREAESVHFLDIPSASPLSREEEVVLRKVRALQSAVGLGRTARSEIKTKMPVIRVAVVCDSPELRGDLMEMKNYLREELNAMEVEFPEDADAWGRLLIACDNKALGQRFKAEAGRIKKLVESHPEPKRIVGALDSPTGSFEIEPGKMLLPGDVSASRVFSRAGEDAANFRSASNNDGSLMIVVDKRETLALKTSGLARELKALVQRLRKKSGLIPSDVVSVYLGLRWRGTPTLPTCPEEVQELRRLAFSEMPEDEPFKKRHFGFRLVNAEATTDGLPKYGVVAVRASETLLAGAVEVDIALVRPHVEFPASGGLKESPAMQHLVASLGDSRLASLGSFKIRVDGVSKQVVQGVDYLALR